MAGPLAVDLPARAGRRHVVCVYCAASPAISGHYLELAGDIGAGIAARGWDLVSGGGRVSLMGAVLRGGQSGRRSVPIGAGQRTATDSAPRWPARTNAPMSAMDARDSGSSLPNAWNTCSCRSQACRVHGTPARANRRARSSESQ
jgi:hypothetical protein